jgi:hypothetical protein
MQDAIVPHIRVQFFYHQTARKLRMLASDGDGLFLEDEVPRTQLQAQETIMRNIQAGYDVTVTTYP